MDYLTECDGVRPFVEDYAFGRLMNIQERRGVREHLFDCNDCMGDYGKICREKKSMAKLLAEQDL